MSSHSRHCFHVELIPVFSMKRRGAEWVDYSEHLDSWSIAIWNLIPIAVDIGSRTTQRGDENRDQCKEFFAEICKLRRWMPEFLSLFSRLRVLRLQALCFLKFRIHIVEKFSEFGQWWFSEECDINWSKIIGIENRKGFFFEFAYKGMFFIRQIEVT